MKKGLLLGAGASYEVGMPLVNELTNTIKNNVLKRIDTNLFNFNNDKKLKTNFINILKNMTNYELAIYELEKEYLKSQCSNLYGVIIQLIECIQLLLLEEQKNINKLFLNKINDYYGLKSFFEHEKQLNVFTLNHDVVFEEILNYFEIPYKDGFFIDKTHNYTNVGNFNILSLKQLQSHKINFFEENEKGVNLLKIHGSIDIFSAEDKEILLKINGNSRKFYDIYDEIKKLEELNRRVCEKDEIRTTNELTIYDNKNILQFLRRSLLTGGHKYSNKFQQIIPKEFLEIFKIKLNNLDELIIIGYSLGDKHINEVLFDWLKNTHNRIKIYDPFVSLPDTFKKYEKQVTLKQATFTDFCLTMSSSRESKYTKITRCMLDLVRNNLKNKRLDK